MTLESPPIIHRAAYWCERVTRRSWKQWQSHNPRLSNRQEVNAARHTHIVVATELQNTQQLSGRTVLPQSPFPFFPR
jgi:hypothetical protein